MVRRRLLAPTVSGWRGQVLGLQEGQHRRRLAQTHVVGQAGSQSETLQHLEPGHAALLIGTQFADEPVGSRPYVERAFQLAAQQRPQLSFGRDAEHRDPGLLGADARRHLEHLADGHGAVGLALGLRRPRSDQALHLGRSELHPLAADVDERCLQLGQPEQLGLVDLLVAQCGFPVEGADAVLVEQSSRARPSGRGGR